LRKRELAVMWLQLMDKTAGKRRPQQLGFVNRSRLKALRCPPR
jgi:hypothetical protein